MSEHNDTTRTVLALRIAELAVEHKLPVLQDLALSERLSQVSSGEGIPDSVFAALAAVLGFLRHEDGLEPD